MNKAHNQLRVVVQHFFKMRYKPAFIGAVPRKTTTQMIVHATICHAVQGGLEHLEGL